MFINVSTNYNCHFTLLLSFSLRPRIKLESGRQFIPGLPTPGYELVNEVTIHLHVIASRGFWLIQRRPHECSSQIRPGRSPKVRMSTEERAINCFEDEVSSRIRKDELAIAILGWFPSTPLSPHLFICFNERRIIRSCRAYQKCTHRSARNLWETGCENLPLRLWTLLKIFWRIVKKAYK